MVVTVASYKGGVAKTTTAIHIGDYLNGIAPTLVVDYDPNRSAQAWHQRGRLQVPVIGEKHLMRHGKNYTHIVADTEVSPKKSEIVDLVTGCDLLIVPTTPDALSLDALLLTIEAIQSVGAANYRILLTIVPPAPSHAGDDAREMLKKSNLPTFKTWIRKYVAFQKAALDGCLVGEVAGDPHAADGAADYLAVGREILK